jgi:tetratricopeptide (TPR) repeat protein
MAAETQQQAVGERGIGVQISGDGNTVVAYAGGSELSLLRKHLRQAGPKTELQLLRVDLRATTLIAREKDLSSLEAWLASDRPISVRCITGRAGIGKTRLAIELCERAERGGWTAGFAQHGQFSEFVKHAGEWRWSKPTLVVIDYAAALARDLRTWLEILARPEAQAGGNKLRLLLLERHAERDLGWWADLMRPVSFSDPAPDELADPPEPAPLFSLNVVEDRRRLLAEAMRLAAHIAGVQPSPHPPLPAANEDFDRRLGDDTINNEPLYLMMAGVEAIRTGASTALALTRTDLAERAASRERERLNRLASEWGVSDKLVAHLAMCATFQGGGSAEEALQLVTEERRGMGFPETGPAVDLVNRLGEALPMPSGAAVDAVRPDLIGEAFLLQVMQEYRRLPRLQTEIIYRAWRRAEREVSATLIRTAQDYAQGDVNHCSVVWLRYLIDQANVESAMSVAKNLPKDTLALREVSQILYERLERALALRVKSERSLRPVLAAVRNDLAAKLRDLGELDLALIPAAGAVALRRKLVARRPDVFRAALADSLNTLAALQSDLGQYEPALTTAEEGVSIYRELAERRPHTFVSNLSMLLNNLAAIQSKLGRQEQALASVMEAVATRRQLAAERPDAYRPDLASSLNNLGHILRILGRGEEALGPANESVAIYRELAGQRPDAFRPHLAMSLNNLTSIMRDLGQGEPALSSAKEAVAIYHELAAQRPEAFRHDLASSLVNLTAILGALGQREPALAAGEEAVAIYRELVDRTPDAFRPGLAFALNNLAAMLNIVDRHESALAAAREALSLYRELAAQRPEAFRPDLASTYNNLSAIWEGLNRPILAVATAKLAVTTLTPAFVAQPTAFRSRMVVILLRYLTSCKRAGREAEANQLEPSFTILRSLYGQTETEDQMSIEIAAVAVSVLAPYLTEAVKEGAKTVGKETAEAGLKVLGWMREKLTGRAKEALAELEQKPDSQLNQDDLRTQLAKLLEKQPELVPQLQELLAEAKPLGDVMSQTVGEGGKASQIKGDRNTVSIS